MSEQIDFNCPYGCGGIVTYDESVCGGCGGDIEWIEVEPELDKIPHKPGGIKPIPAGSGG